MAGEQRGKQQRAVSGWRPERAVGGWTGEKGVAAGQQRGEAACDRV